MDWSTPTGKGFLRHRTKKKKGRAVQFYIYEKILTLNVKTLWHPESCMQAKACTTVHPQGLKICPELDITHAMQLDNIFSFADHLILRGRKSKYVGDQVRDIDPPLATYNNLYILRSYAL